MLNGRVANRLSGKYTGSFYRPPKPRDFIKWLLSYPGFLWPWNSVYLLITVVSWFYLQPNLSRCVQFRADWIGLMFLRNLGLIWLVAGGWHLLLYTFKVQGLERKYDARWLRTGDRNFTFHNQLWDNIFWSCTSGCAIWTAYEVVYMWAAANHQCAVCGLAGTPRLLRPCGCVRFRSGGSFTSTGFIAPSTGSRCISTCITSTNKNVNPGPWSGLAMHPVEHLFYFSVVLIHFVCAVASHPLSLQCPAHRVDAGGRSSRI